MFAKVKILRIQMSTHWDSFCTILGTATSARTYLQGIHVETDVRERVPPDGLREIVDEPEESSHQHEDTLYRATFNHAWGQYTIM